MPDLDKALADIAAMREQIARGTEFRGYGPVTVAATAMLALAAGAAQALWLPQPADHVFAYVVLWVAVAAAAVALIGVEMVARTRRLHRGLADAMLYAAVEQFIPAGVAGALVTVVLYRFAPASLWMLPGLWQIMFSLGLFAAARGLPRPMFAAAVWYLAAGLANLAFADPFSPFAMALPFAAGQAFIAVVLYRNIGADDGES
jgi:hypothetical protein